MKALFEEYGSMFIAVLGGLLVLLLAISLFSSGGALNDYIEDFIESAC